MRGAARAIRKAFDQHGALRVVFQHVGQLARRIRAIGRQVCLVRAKQHVTQGDDHAAFGFLGGQVGQLRFESGGAGLRIAGRCFRRLRLGLGRFRIRLRRLGAGRGLVSLLRARIEAQLVALLAGVGDIGFRGFLLGDFLRRGYLLLGQVGQLVDLFAVILARGGRVRRFQRSARFAEFAWRIGRHQRVRLRRHVVAARLVEQAGGGRCGAAGGN